MNTSGRLRTRVAVGVCALAVAACGHDESARTNQIASSPPPSLSTSSLTTTAASTTLKAARGNALIPADAPLPAAGACARASAHIAEIDVNPDAPSPRCVVVDQGQYLLVRNTTDQFGGPGATVSVRWANARPVSLRPGQSHAFPALFGTYLAPGVHWLHISHYAGSAEIWLR